MLPTKPKAAIAVHQLREFISAIQCCTADDLPQVVEYIQACQENLDPSDEYDRHYIDFGNAVAQFVGM